MPIDLPEAAKRLGVELNPAQVDQFRKFRDSLARSAQEYSLTSVRDPEQIETRHLLEAIAFGALLAQRGLFEGRSRVLDIGSGAGLPGIPLKLAWPQLRMTLLEATGKKCRFMEQAITELGLKDVNVLEGRAEEVARQPAHRAGYDLAVARAVAPLPVLLEYALPCLKRDGVFVANKGSAAAREIEASEAALRELGGVIEETLPFYPPRVIGQTVVFVRKVSETPERYPRRVGIPSKRPL